MRPQPERIVYPAMRECVSTIPTTNTPAPNCWTIDHDNKEWVAQGKTFSMYKHDRDYAAIRKPASASDFYNTDQGPKMSVGQRVQRSGYRYVGMRTQSAGRGGVASLSTGARVGPGAYNPHLATMPRQAPMMSAFASGSLSRPFAGARSAGDICCASIAQDERRRKDLYYQKQKGVPMLHAQRWERPVGPGSNLPSAKLPPGPGAYGKAHSWPATGFLGTARGFNHNQ